jgi:hypothetical protein
LVVEGVGGDAEDVGWVPLLGGGGGRVEVVRELVRPGLEVLELGSEQVDDAREVLLEELGDLGRFVVGERSSVGGVADDVAEVAVLVGDLGARGGVEDSLGDGGRGRGAVDVGPAGDARGEHALREEECEPEADRGGVLRAEQRLLGVVRQRRLHFPHDAAQGSAEEVRNREGIERRGGEARRRDRASRAVDSCDAAGSRIVGA